MFAGATREFFRQQEGFVKEICRLAKYWYKSLNFPTHVSGVKTLVELIAVYAMHKEHAVGCFERILDFIIGYDSLDIVFNYKSAKYNKIARKAILPRVMDPANPLNNLAEVFSNKPDINMKEMEEMSEMKEKLISYARETKLRLWEVINADLKVENLFDF